MLFHACIQNAGQAEIAESLRLTDQKAWFNRYQVPVSVNFTTVERQLLKKVLYKCMQARTYAHTYTQIKYAHLASVDALKCPLSQLLFQVKYLLFPTLEACKSTKTTAKYICIDYLSLEKLIS